MALDVNVMQAMPYTTTCRYGFMLNPDFTPYTISINIWYMDNIAFLTRQSEMADLARRATRDLSQFHMGGPNFDTGRSWKL